MILARYYLWWVKNWALTKRKEGTDVKKNANANVAVTVGGALIAAEQLAQTYLGAHIGPFWSKAIVGAGVYVVLLVGRDGIKGALARAKSVAKTVWSGTNAKPSSPGPPAA